MKHRVYHLKAETRARLVRLSEDIDRLLSYDNSVSGLRSPSDFLIVRPSLFSMYSHLWGRDDSSLVKSVIFEDDLPF